MRRERPRAGGRVLQTGSQPHPYHLSGFGNDVSFISRVTVRTPAAQVFYYIMAVVGISKDSKDTFTISAQ